MTHDLFHKKKMIDEFMAQEGGCLSSFSFVNVFIWKDFFEFRFEIINDYLCVFAAHEPGCFLYFPPLKKNLPSSIAGLNPSQREAFLSAVQKCFQIMEDRNRSNGVSRIENIPVGYLGLFPQNEFSFFKKAYEYCCFTEEVVSLQGNAFKSKRASYNHFVKNYRYEFFPFNEEMTEACGELYDRWAKNRLGKYDDDVYNHLLAENRVVHQLAMRYYEELGLVGRVVVVDGKIQGYSFGFPLNPSVFCILFEITALEIKGLSVFIFREFCRDPQVKNYKFINVMDDFGMKNIAAVKMSFRPTVLLPSYVATRKREC